GGRTSVMCARGADSARLPSRLTIPASARSTETTTSPKGAARYAPHGAAVKIKLSTCRGAAILSSLKRSAIMSSPSAMKANGTDGGGAVEAVGRGGAVGHGEAHAAGGGAGASTFRPAGPPHPAGGRARRPGGAATRQRRAGAGEQAPGGGAEPDPAAAADEVSRLQRRALHGEARRGAAPAADLRADGAPRVACGRRAGRPAAAAPEASAPARSQGAGRADAPVGRKPPRLAGGPRAVAVPHRRDRCRERRA